MNPSPNGPNGRDGKGRFVKGNAGGPGNPLSKQSGTLRAMLLSSVTEDDFRAIMAHLVANARNGEPWAIKEILDRLLGRPVQSVDVELGGGPTILQVVYHVVTPTPDGGIRTIDGPPDRE